VIKLTEPQKRLLESIVAQRDPTRLAELKAIFDSDVRELSHETRFHLAQLVTDEFIASGRRSTDEPNERGLLLEELTDVLKPYDAL